MALSGGDDQVPPGGPMTVSTRLIDAGSTIMQRRLPVKQMNTHVSTFAIYGGDMSRLIGTHHYVHRVNDEFLQCAVYASDRSDAPLIGIEYVISDRLYETLSEDEQKLWHSHAYEVKSGSWAYPRLPEVVAAPELKNIAKTYGKFWCTWQIDRGMSPHLNTGPKPDPDRFYVNRFYQLVYRLIVWLNN